VAPRLDDETVEFATLDRRIVCDVAYLSAPSLLVKERRRLFFRRTLTRGTSLIIIHSYSSSRSCWCQVGSLRGTQIRRHISHQNIHSYSSAPSCWCRSTSPVLTWTSLHHNVVPRVQNRCLTWQSSCSSCTLVLHLGFHHFCRHDMYLSSLMMVKLRGISKSIQSPTRPRGIVADGAGLSLVHSREMRLRWLKRWGSTF